MTNDFDEVRSKIVQLSSDCSERSVRKSVATFLFMVMPIDGQSHPKELDRLSRILSDDFDLTENETADLIATARQSNADANEMICMAEVLKSGLSKKDILILVSHMWEMVFADGRLHETEVLLVERVASLLGVNPDEVQLAMTS